MGESGIGGDLFNGPAPNANNGWDPTGKTQSEIAAHDAAAFKEGQDWNLEHDSKAYKLSRIDHENTYHSPGATDVGGYVGGAKDQSDFFASGEHNNDYSQKNNAAAQAAAIANMKGDRGVMSPENATLLARQDKARGQQGQALDLSRDAAMGNAPSASDAAMAMQMNDNMAGQAGAAGSAKGLSALGGVQTAGAAGTGMAGTQAAMAGGMGRSKEIGEAMGQYGQSAGNMVQGDINRLGQGDKNSIGNAQLNDAWTEGNANLAVNQGKLGLSQQQADDAWYNQSQDPYKRQMQYDSRMNALQNGADVDTADAMKAARQAGEDRNRALIGGGVQMGLTAVGTMYGGPAGGAAGGALGGMANSYITDRKNF